MLQRWVAGALVAATLGACRSSVDPDRGRFSCSADVDCGEGYVCRAQHQGGSLCFKPAECAALEQCNGVDDTCDGQVDESFAEQGQACASGLLGACAAGERRCDGGQVVCEPVTSSQPERCNLVDDDCDGTVDDGFDLTADDANCGGCGRACSAGTGCRLGACVETRCDDGVDNDGDGGVDCDDSACLGLACGSDAGFNCGRGALRFDGGASDGGDGGGGLDAGPLDGGEPDAGGPDAGPGDGGEVDAGTDGGAGVSSCVLRESACGDGLDDDFDGRPDCGDVDCEGRSCDAGLSCAAGQCR